MQGVPWSGRYIFFILVLATTVLLLWRCCIRPPRRETDLDYNGRGKRFVRAIVLMLAAASRVVKRVSALLDESRAKLKIMITFYQIVSHIEHTYHVQYPEAVHKVLSAIPLSLSNLGGFLQVLPIFRTVCFGLDLHGLLLVSIMAPIALALVPVIVTKLRGHSAVSVVHLILGWSFLVYPTIVAMGFNAIGECDCFTNVATGGDGGNSTCFLRANYNEECTPSGTLTGWPVNSAITNLAFVAIVLYGVGVPLVHLALVMRDRDAIVNDKPLIGLSAKISFLHADYSPNVFWWEFVESMKKLVLTGILALLAPGSLLQIFVAIVITFVVLMLQSLVSPMKTASDNVLAFLSAVMLALVFIGSAFFQAMAKVEEASPTREGNVDDSDIAETLLIPGLLIGAVLVIALATVVTFILRLRALRAANMPTRTAPDEVQPLPPLRTQLLSDVDSAADAGAFLRERTRNGAYDVELNDAATAAARPQGASAEEEAPVAQNKASVEQDDL